MTFRFSQRSESNMQGVHPDLIRVVRRALELTEVDFMVIDGLRTMAEQRELVRRGKSQTMHSRHLTGHAVDVVPIVGGRVSWDWPPFHRLAAAMKQAAQELRIPIEWGGDWRSFKDGPHFQLPRAQYP